MMPIELYSRVALTAPLSGYARGTAGYVVERLTDTHVLVELFDAEGAYLAVEDVPVESLTASPAAPKQGEALR